MACGDESAMNPIHTVTFRELPRISLLGTWVNKGKRKGSRSHLSEARVEGREVSGSVVGGVALIVGAAYYFFFPGHEYLGYSPLAAQHRLSVHHHDDHDNDSEYVVLPGLSVRIYRVVHLEVVQGRN